MTKSPSTKPIVLGVTGGIAAYKACEIVRLFKKQGHRVAVVMTEGAQKFVTPLTFQTLSGHPVATSLFDLDQESQIGHINLADDGAALVVAPATANAIAKFAHGLADDLLSTIALATRAPLLVAPAMNVNMWEHAATQENLNTLKKRGAIIIEPESGELACGWTGMGRLAEPEKIVKTVLDALKSQ